MSSLLRSSFLLGSAFLLLISPISSCPRNYADTDESGTSLIDWVEEFNGRKDGIHPKGSSLTQGNSDDGDLYSSVIDVNIGSEITSFTSDFYEGFYRMSDSLGNRFMVKDPKTNENLNSSVKVVLNPFTYDFRAYPELSDAEAVVEVILEEGDLLHISYFPTDGLAAASLWDKGYWPDEETMDRLVLSMNRESDFKSRLYPILSNAGQVKPMSTESDSQEKELSDFEVGGGCTDEPFLPVRVQEGWPYGDSRYLTAYFTDSLSVVRHLPTTDDTIVNYIPKVQFVEPGTYVNVGQEWGYYMNTFRSNGNDMYTNLLLFSIDRTKDYFSEASGLYTSYFSIKATPILNQNYRYDSLTGKVISDVSGVLAISSPRLLATLRYVDGLFGTDSNLNPHDPGYCERNDRGFAFGDFGVIAEGEPANQIKDSHWDDILRLLLQIGVAYLGYQFPILTATPLRSIAYDFLTTFLTEFLINSAAVALDEFNADENGEMELGTQSGNEDLTCCQREFSTNRGFGCRILDDDLGLEKTISVMATNPNESNPYLMYNQEHSVMFFYHMMEGFYHNELKIDQDEERRTYAAEIFNMFYFQIYKRKLVGNSYSADFIGDFGGGWSEFFCPEGNASGPTLSGAGMKSGDFWFGNEDALNKASDFETSVSCSESGVYRFVLSIPVAGADVYFDGQKVGSTGLRSSAVFPSKYTYLPEQEIITFERSLTAGSYSRNLKVTLRSGLSGMHKGHIKMFKVGSSLSKDGLLLPLDFEEKATFRTSSMIFPFTPLETQVHFVGADYSPGVLDNAKTKPSVYLYNDDFMLMASDADGNRGPGFYAKLNAGETYYVGVEDPNYFSMNNLMVFTRTALTLPCIPGRTIELGQSVKSGTKLQYFFETGDQNRTLSLTIPSLSPGLLDVKFMILTERCSINLSKTGDVSYFEASYTFSRGERYQIYFEFSGGSSILSRSIDILWSIQQ